MDNQGELHKYFVIVFEKAWNANFFVNVLILKTLIYFVNDLIEKGI